MIARSAYKMSDSDDGKTKVKIKVHLSSQSDDDETSDAPDEEEDHGSPSNAKVAKPLNMKAVGSEESNKDKDKKVEEEVRAKTKSELEEEYRDVKTKIAGEDGEADLKSKSATASREEQLADKEPSAQDSKELPVDGKEEADSKAKPTSGENISKQNEEEKKETSKEYAAADGANNSNKISAEMKDSYGDVDTKGPETQTDDPEKESREKKFSAQQVDQKDLSKPSSPDNDSNQLGKVEEPKQPEETKKSLSEKAEEKPSEEEEEPQQTGKVEEPKQSGKVEEQQSGNVEEPHLSEKVIETKPSGEVQEPKQSGKEKEPEVAEKLVKESQGNEKGSPTPSVESFHKDLLDSQEKPSGNMSGGSGGHADKYPPENAVSKGGRSKEPKKDRYVSWSSRWRNKDKKKKKDKRAKKGLAKIPDFPVKCKASDLKVNVPEMLLDDADANDLPAACKVLKARGAGELYLLGTSHFSKKSRSEVAQTIRIVKPQAVVVELDLSRLYILQLDEREMLQQTKKESWWDQVKFVSSRKYHHGLIDVFLSIVGNILIRTSGVVPGGEFRTAVAEAQRLEHCDIHLGDRPLNITLARVSSKLSLLEKALLLKCLTPRPFSKDEVSSKEAVEIATTEEKVSAVLKTTKGKYLRQRTRPKFV